MGCVELEIRVLFLSYMNKCLVGMVNLVFIVA